jgi:hypothetical protein
MALISIHSVCNIKLFFVRIDSGAPYMEHTNTKLHTDFLFSVFNEIRAISMKYHVKSSFEFILSEVVVRSGILDLTSLLVFHTMDPISYQT